MQMTVRIDVGMLRSCDVAMVLFVVGQSVSIMNHHLLMRKEDVRKTQIGNNRWLVESQSMGAHGKESPDESKHPQTTVFERLDYFSKVEVEFIRSRCIARKSSLDEGLFFIGQPSGLWRN